MTPNPYQSPHELKASHAPAPTADATPSSMLLRGCLSLLLVPFVLFFGCAGVIARIDSDEELLECIIIDVLVGAAMLGLVLLHSGWLFLAMPWWKKLILALLPAILCAGTLIGWHSFTVYMRNHAIDDFRQRQAVP